LGARRCQEVKEAKKIDVNWICCDTRAAGGRGVVRALLAASF